MKVLMSFPADIARASRKVIQTDLWLSLPSKVRGLSDNASHTFFNEVVVKCEHRSVLLLLVGDDKRDGALGVVVLPSSLAFVVEDEVDSSLLLDRPKRR